MSHWYVQRPAESAPDVVAHHTKLIMEGLEIWERYCKARSDEEQQDLRITFRINSAGREPFDTTFVWNPGLQRACLKLGSQE